MKRPINIRFWYFLHDLAGRVMHWIYWTKLAPPTPEVPAEAFSYMAYLNSKTGEMCGVSPQVLYWSKGHGEIDLGKEL